MTIGVKLGYKPVWEARKRKEHGPSEESPCLYGGSEIRGPPCYTMFQYV